MITTVAMLAIAVVSKPRNLLVNGDFSLGVKGFTSEYGLAPRLGVDGTYNVSTNPSNLHGHAFSFGDHTSGHGNMLLVNGSSHDGLSFWSEKVRVQPHHVYHFEGWMASWSMTPFSDTPTDVSPAIIDPTINGGRIGAGFKVDEHSGNWMKFEFDWDSGNATTAKIDLRDDNVEVNGNDFAIDDLAFYRTK